MAKMNIELTINTSDDENKPSSYSSTTIRTDSLDELQRMLSLAGINATPAETPVEPEVEIVEEPEVYTQTADYKPRMPDQKLNNPRFSDNSIAEDAGFGANAREIADVYFSFLDFVDGEEAVARTADHFGVTGEEIERAVREVVDAEAFAETEEVSCEDCEVEDKLEPACKTLRDYMSEASSDSKEITMTLSGDVLGTFMDNLDYRAAKAYLDSYPAGILQNDTFETGSFIFKNRKGQYRFFNVNADEVQDWDWKTDIKELVDTFNGDTRDIKAFLGGFWYEPADEYFPEVKGGMDFYNEILDEAYGQSWEAKHGGYVGTVALLPIERMMVTLDQIGENEYFGDDLTSGRSGIVCFAIETGTANPRYTFASTYGNASEYRPNEKYMTYHDQTGKERPARVVTSFSGKEYMDPKGRETIKSNMAKGGMDPRKKYSVRVFK